MPDCEMPEKQIICAWYSNKMSINRLSAPNSNICLIRLCAWSNFILLLSASCQSSPGPKHFLISSILFSFYPIQSVLCFDVSCLIIEEQDTNTGVNLQKKSTLWLTNASIQCSQNQVINGSYLSQRFYLQVVRLLLRTGGQAQATHTDSFRQKAV